MSVDLWMCNLFWKQNKKTLKEDSKNHDHIPRVFYSTAFRLHTSTVDCTDWLCSTPDTLSYTKRTTDNVWSPLPTISLGKGDHNFILLVSDGFSHPSLSGSVLGVSVRGDPERSWPKLDQSDRGRNFIPKFKGNNSF